MTCDKKPILKVEDFGIIRGSFEMKNISFQVSEKEILSIIGRTGSGKTMLLESIAGFYEPGNGSIKLYNKEISRIPIYQRNIGYLYQDYCLFPHMNVESNIAYGLKTRKINQAEIKQRVSEISEQFSISHLRKAYPATLSGGEQQRVALARALITKPDLLLLDEPFSALDPMTQKRMYQIVKEIREQYGCAIILVTHDFLQAQELSDRIGVMLSGRLCGIIDSNELYTHAWAHEVEEFLGISE